MSVQIVNHIQYKRAVEALEDKTLDIIAITLYLHAVGIGIDSYDFRIWDLYASHLSHKNNILIGNI